MNFLQDLERQAIPLRDTIRSCLENGTPVRISGARTWLSAGRSVQAMEELNVAESGVVEYVPGDFTITVRAGTPLDQIAAVTAANKQWLVLDPFGSPSGTVGATISTASAGPLSHAFGTPRDQVIGLGFVTGKGDYVRSGGRVVKNVAGFDLTRLLVGSWGTLGIITDATLRLRSRPDVDTTIALGMPDDETNFRRALAMLDNAPLNAFALELLNSALAEGLGLGAQCVLLARFGGNEAAVTAQHQALRAIGDTSELSSDVWDGLRATEPKDAAVARLSGAISEFLSLWRAAEKAFASTTILMHGTPARGQIRCMVDPAGAGLLGSFLEENAMVRKVFERLPADSWSRVPSPVNASLAKRVRVAFDPASLLNPGILGQPAT